MKRIILTFLATVAIVFALLYFSGTPKKPSAALKFRKQVAEAPLTATASIALGGSSYRLYCLQDSIYALLDNNTYVSVDPGLSKTTVHSYPFSLNKSSVWYLHKQGSAFNYLVYPTGQLFVADKGTIKANAYRTLINNCTAGGDRFYGLTFDSTDTNAFISWFTLTGPAMHRLYDLSAVFAGAEGFAADCFTSSVDGNFFSINDTAFVFYNYYSSYLLRFGPQHCQLVTGIDSIPMRSFRKIKSRMGDIEMERCEPEDDKFIHRSGCSDGQYVYMLSNITRAAFKGQLLIDVYDSGLQYIRSFKVPGRSAAQPSHITASRGSLYIAYDDNHLVKYAKPL